MVDALLLLAMLVVIALPLALTALPPLVWLGQRRAPLPAVLLYLTALGFLVAWVVASNEHMDWADRTGGEGSIWAGGPWLVAAALTAAGSVWQTLRAQRSKAVG